MRRFAGALLIALSISVTGASAQGWERLDRITDVPLDGARDVTADLRTGPVAIDLPWTTTVLGAGVDGLVVGEGWIELRRSPARGASLVAADGSPMRNATLVGAPESLPPLRIDVLAGDQVHLGAEGLARVVVAGDGIAVRWAGLATPGGTAHAEILISRAGEVAIQYLRVPAELLPDIRSGRIRAGTRSNPLEPASARAFRLRGLDVPRPMPGPIEPDNSGPPPTGCVVEAGNWCQRADGPSASRIYIQQDFDGGYDVGGPFLVGGIGGRTNQWHITPWAACPPGASGSGGQSAYFGADATCSYAARAGGRLLSPTVGPITATTQLAFASRIQYEDFFDTAEIYVNGTLLGAMPANTDPNLWYNFTAPLNAWAGQNIQLEFRFVADNSNQFIGWFVDDVVVWDPAAPGLVDCIRSAGFVDNAPCDQRVSTQWDFNENDFCQGCNYVFYVLVECGREMHVPLLDMEGVDLRVTNMVTGLPVPLRCRNQTSLADAGLGAYPGQNALDVNGLPLDCCAGGGPEVWWGPAFDQTDPGGHVTWGLAQGCPIQTIYDRNANNALECGEVPPTCGGLLSQISPGDAQVMDCSITDENGLCGLYRVQVLSGGFVWSLFANCDGTNTPQFQIFHDCTEAWTAYNPLPELAIDNLVTTSGCPNLTVSFDIVNLGCVDFAGNIPIRITSNCVPPDTFNTTIPGPLPAGGTIPVSLPFTASCTPVRIEVFADPANIIAECTESPTVAACRAVAGVDSLATFTCGCTAQLNANAGADVAACPGVRVTLDASASTIAPCAAPEYRWLDALGGIVQDWRSTSTLAVDVASCPGGRVYTLEVHCRGESCSDTDTIRVDCILLTADAGTDTRACVGDPVTLDGSGSAIVNCANPEYRWFDPLGREARTWNPSPVLNLGPLTCNISGDYTLEVHCAGDVTCSEIDDVNVACVEVIADAGPDLVTCEGAQFDITQATSTATGCTDVLYAWFDLAGNPLTTFDPSPDFSGSLTNCPGTATLVLVATCNDVGFEACGTFDTVDIACPKPEVPVPTATPGCARTSSLDCGVAEAGVTYWWDTDTTVDSNADGDPANDPDLAGCAVVATFAAAGAHPVRAWAREPSVNCTSFADVTADAFDDPAPPSPTAVPGCPGSDSTLSCGTADPGLTYDWDVDTSVDSSGNTVPDDDVDLSGCNVATPYAAGSHIAQVTARDVRGCTATGAVLVVVTGSSNLPEVQDDRVVHGITSLTFTWSPVAGARTYRVSRGLIGTWYSHAADDTTGRGTCDTLTLTTWTDPDDAADAGDYYYLITAVEPCGLEGTPGNKWNHVAYTPRDPRTPTASCP